MIKKLLIKNIQSHKETKLSFSTGVNMIIGKSENGKSAILNSLFWCMYNRPLGDPHRNWGGGVMQVSATLDNGIVEISRNKQTVYRVMKGEPYKVNKTGKVLEFKASGQSPPDEVTALFNMDRKINFQRQLERDAPIFLISESPGEVAAFLNKVAGLYKIDETVSRGKSDLRETKLKLDSTKEQINTKQNELSKYAGIDDLNSKVATCTQIVKKQAENKRILNEIEYILTSIDEIESYLEELNEKLKIKDTVDSALHLLQIQEQSIGELSKYESIIKLIDFREHRQKKLQKKLEVSPKLKNIQEYMDSKYITEERHEKLHFLFGQIDELEERQEHLTDYKQKQEKVFHNLMPEQCPLCGK